MRFSAVKMPMKSAVFICLCKLITLVLVSLLNYAFLYHAVQELITHVGHYVLVIKVMKPFMINRLCQGQSSFMITCIPHFSEVTHGKRGLIFFKLGGHGVLLFRTV